VLPWLEWHEIADAFNRYLLSVSEGINTKNNHDDFSNNNIKSTMPIHYLLQSFQNPFLNIALKSLSTREVENIIKSLKLKNSHGYDEVSTKILKISSPFISSPLTHIRNKLLVSGISPEC
jgi:hypothetical protein